MDKALLDFLNGTTNVAVFEAMVGRETTPNGMQFIVVKPADGSFTLFEFWYNPQGKDHGDKPKHTGGKKPYAMLMLQELRKLRESGMPQFNEVIGCMANLSDNIEWGTGRLVKGRGKHKKPMESSDIQKLLGYSEWKTDKMLGLMKEHDLLTHTSEGYFVSRRLIKKGKTNKEAPDDPRQVGQ